MNIVMLVLEGSQTGDPLHAPHGALLLNQVTLNVLSNAAGM